MTRGMMTLLILASLVTLLEVPAVLIQAAGASGWGAHRHAASASKERTTALPGEWEQRCCRAID